MPVDFMMRRNDTWREPQTLQFHQIHSLNIRADQIIKDFVISGKSPHHSSLVHPAGADLIIIVFCPASVTAELLVSPAITYPIPALQTHGRFS